MSSICLTPSLDLQFAQSFWSIQCTENRLSSDSYVKQVAEAIFPSVTLDLDSDDVGIILNVLQKPPMMNKRLSDAFLRYEKEVG